MLLTSLDACSPSALPFSSGTGSGQHASSRCCCSGQLLMSPLLPCCSESCCSNLLGKLLRRHGVTLTWPWRCSQWQGALLGWLARPSSTLLPRLLLHRHRAIAGTSKQKVTACFSPMIRSSSRQSSAKQGSSEASCTCCAERFVPVPKSYSF